MALKESQALNTGVSFSLALAIASALHHQFSILEQNLDLIHHRLSFDQLPTTLALDCLEFGLGTDLEQWTEFEVAATADDELLLWLFVNIF